MKLLIAFSLSLFVWQAQAKMCKGFGPQTPRDLTKTEGTNPIKFSFAPAHTEMNLCNIHFHKNAEHKASGFSVSGGEGDFGGWKCNGTDKLTAKELKAPKKNYCENIEVGDTIEVHWVHSTCPVKPGPTLGACLTDNCPNPQLRVETKVFMVVNDKKAMNFRKFDAGKKRKGYHQAKAYPDRSDALQFLGSTTGPSYTEEKCSPLSVTWNVSQSCAKVDINTLSRWCKSNKFNEKKAHGVRQIVKNKKLLSEIN